MKLLSSAMASATKQVVVGWQQLSTAPVAVVPTVDLSLPLHEVGHSIHEACTTVGFFLVQNHGVSPHLLSSVMQEARHFFNLPQEEKDRISIRNSSSFRGYQQVGENVTMGAADAHEAVDFMSESERAKRANTAGPTNYGTNQWPCPSVAPQLRPVLQQYIFEMNQVGSKMMQACALGLGLSQHYFARYFEDPFWILRLIHYPPKPTSMDDTLGCGEHTDYGIFTFIYSENVPETLQIRTTDKDWTFVDPIPESTLICNVGDMLSRWTNGIYKSTLHRVLRPINQNGRVSVPFFYEPSYDAVIRPIDELVQQSRKLPMFGPIQYGDHLLAKTTSNFVFKKD